ncbi:Pseudouridylate synthase 7 [Paragonimus heterotremus]|uniref:Pseudouridylate synthase 7 n=1 Tax=Paragonimus heterotremus TaxID=100268 RepID=A0A8J4SUJ3_9TREM|nr:Pseudouridylate synthase 7 [Paragonimus heterotremus]
MFACKRPRISETTLPENEASELLDELREKHPDKPRCSLAIVVGNQSCVLSEADVGITSYVNRKDPGFQCTLKNRSVRNLYQYEFICLYSWEDFVVREVLGGDLAKLTDASPIRSVPNVVDGKVDNSLLDPFLVELQKLTSGEIKCVRIKVRMVLTVYKPVRLYQAPSNKQERTIIHNTLRAVFPSLCSTTLCEGTDHCILVSKPGHAVDVRVPKRADSTLMKGKRYCRFVLYKEGRDTINAIQTLSRYLRVSPGCFGYAGTKDKRAITAQFVTVKDVDSEKLASLNGRLHGIFVGNFSYVPRPLFLGDLDGNQFTVVLRSVSASMSSIDVSIESWKSNGFINYFGLQRFGHSAKSKSFDIGRHLIRSEWVEAINLILVPTDADLSLVRKAKEQFLVSGDAAQCATETPPSIEKYLLQGVAQHGKTLNALQTLPRNLRQLYVHSYQSFLWNRIASRRVDELGVSTKCAIPGDLYLPRAGSALLSNDTGKFLINDSVCLEVACSPSPTYRSLPKPLIATVENCHQIPLTDVVLPLPGYEVVFPNNQCKQWYVDLLKEDGLTFDDFRHRVKDFALPGSYRALLATPKDVTYHVTAYTDRNVPLIKSDLQLLTEAESKLTKREPSSQGFPEAHSGQVEHGLILQFCLPKSSYATMAIRELTKMVFEKH